MLRFRWLMAFPLLPSLPSPCPNPLRNMWATSPTRQQTPTSGDMVYFASSLRFCSGNTPEGNHEGLVGRFAYCRWHLARGSNPDSISEEVEALPIGHSSCYSVRFGPHPSVSH